MRRYRVRRAGPLRGSLTVPGDKSIGHRALLFAGLAEGSSRIRGLSGGLDNHATRGALEAMGVRFEDVEGETRVEGVSELDDGTRVPIAFRTRLAETDDPLGRRVAASGALVKARAASGEYLLFRGLPERRVTQTIVTERELAALRLAPAR